MFCSRPKCFCPWDSIWIVTLLHQDIVQVKYWIKCMSLFPVCYIFNIINIYTINKIKYCSCSNAFVSSHGSEFPAREKKKKLHSQEKLSVNFPPALRIFFIALVFMQPFSKAGKQSLCRQSWFWKNPLYCFQLQYQTEFLFQKLSITFSLSKSTQHDPAHAGWKSS